MSAVSAGVGACAGSVLCVLCSVEGTSVVVVSADVYIHTYMCSGLLFGFSLAVPPVFLSTSPRVDVVMNSTDAVILNCSIRGYPISTLRWRKDGTPLDPDGLHINITTFRSQDPMDTYPLDMYNSFQLIPEEGLEYFEAVSELTLVPPLLLTDTANYTCEVESVFVQKFSEISDNIPVIIIGESLLTLHFTAAALFF